MGHRAPVLDDVGNTRRRAHVVLEYAQASVSAAHEINPCNMDAHTAGRNDSGHRVMEVLRRHHEPPGNDAVPQDLTGAVHVVEERFERAHALGDAALDEQPLARRDHARDEVERERPLLLARVRERDAAIAEHAIARRAALVEVVARQRLNLLEQRCVVLAWTPAHLEHLVAAAGQEIVVEQVAHPDSVPDQFEQRGYRAMTGRRQVPSSRSDSAAPPLHYGRGPMSRRGDQVVITNRKARHEYFVEESYECGIVLKGAEVKSIRDGHANLQDGYARIDDGEVWLYGMHVSPYAFSRAELDPVRRRKLLLHHKEITELARATEEKGVTLVPLRVYFKDGRCKVELAIARGKARYDKRQAIADA